MTTLESISYGPINVDEMMRDRGIDMDLISISHHDLSINDDPWQLLDYSRHTQY